MSDEDRNLIDMEYRFSLQKFFVGWAKIITDKQLVVWGFFTWLGRGILLTGKGSTVEIIVTSGWIAVTVIYMLGRSFERGFEQFLKNSKADVNVAVGRQV